MKQIPLITSLPPSMSRLDPEGVEIGRDYALSCVQSWRDCGFSPVSVNSSLETVWDIYGPCGVTCKSVDRDARQVTGKPLVFIKDMLDIGREIADGPIVMTNADILFDEKSPILNQVKELKPGTSIVAKRFDIESVSKIPGTENIFGYDFFAYHSSDLRKYTDERFIFGAPWWDYFLPIIMFLRGVEIVSPPGLMTYHLDHTERWDWDLWARLGRQFLNDIRSELRSKRRAAAANEDYARAFGHAVRGERDGTVRSEIRGTLRYLGIWKNDQDAADALHRIAKVNVEFIDERRGVRVDSCST